MARKHYEIEAKGKLMKNGDSITITDCKSVRKNGILMDDQGHFYKEKEFKYGVTDYILVVDTIVGVIVLFMFLVLYALLRDTGISSDFDIDNIIGGIGLCFAVISTKSFRDWYKNIKCNPKILKKTLLMIIVIFIPHMLVILFHYLGISYSVSNTIGVLAILFSILSY